MTIFAVIGLTAAAVAGTERSSLIEELTRRVEQRDSSISELQAAIRDFERRDDDEIGFTPCWRGDPQGRRFYVAYDVTYSSGRYSVTRHSDFAQGTSTVVGTPNNVVAVLEQLPNGDLDEQAFLEFGRRISDAIRDVYPAGCRLVVTINRQAAGDVIATINRTGFFPLYR